MTYQYGQTHGAASLAYRHRVARLERALRERDERIVNLQNRLDRRKRDDTNRLTAYRDTLTPEELNAPPTLWPGDTPGLCAMRLQAINDESAERASDNRSAAQTRKAVA